MPLSAEHYSELLVYNFLMRSGVMFKAILHIKKITKNQTIHNENWSKR